MWFVLVCLCRRGDCLHLAERWNGVQNPVGVKSLKGKDGKGILAGATGLEPATSGVTGRRYNHLNYAPARVYLLLF